MVLNIHIKTYKVNFKLFISMEINIGIRPSSGQSHTMSTTKKCPAYEAKVLSKLDEIGLRKMTEKFTFDPKNMFAYVSVPKVVALELEKVLPKDKFTMRRMIKEDIQAGNRFYCINTDNAILFFRLPCFCPPSRGEKADELEQIEETGVEVGTQGHQHQRGWS